MKYSVLLILFVIFSLTVFSQKPKSAAKTKPAKASVQQIGDEKEELERAVNEPFATDRITALQKFIKDFPKSADITRARELIVSARAQLGEMQLQAGDAGKGVEFFKLAVKDAPQPLSEQLFADVILQFPTNLFFRGQRVAALEIAQMIEEKAAGDAKQLLGLATFYIAVENSANARRLAQKAIELAPEMPAAYQTLGIASRLGFRLDDAVEAYTKALALDPASVVSKRSLAEMKRANGKTDEAITLYREILAADETDLNARTGLVLSLFDAGKKAEAETEMQKTLEANAGNLPLLVGAAYWYAGNNEGFKAIDLAQKALAVEPRYTWANIALARGLIAEKRPLDAEKVLLAARNYGNFPTLDYEIAVARVEAGFYREAADELRKNFAVKNGVLETYLGNRVGVEAEDFIKLLSLERRAAIFAPNAADTAETAERLKSLLEFSQELNAENADEAAISAAVDKFVRGNDKMKIHRQLFAAGRLLDKKKAMPKVLELTQGAIAGVDSALDVPTPEAAVMADELYEARTQAISRGELLLVPQVPRQTLSVILRGRIEELSGWTLYQQNQPAQAVKHLKRAVSVLPEKSSWWRSSVWRLGSALESDGKQTEALENYIKSYKNGEATSEKYFIIESLYQKVNGNRDGLEEKIGKRPENLPDTIAQVTENTNPEPEVSKTSETVAETSPTPPPTPPTEPENPPTTDTETVSNEETPPETETIFNEENPPTTDTSEIPPPENTPQPEPAPTPEELTETPVVETEPTPIPEEIQIEQPEPESENPTENPPESEITPEQTPEVQPPTETVAENTQTQTIENSTPPPTETEIKSPEDKTLAKAEATPKPLFEPVIINVRKKEDQKAKETETARTSEKSAENPAEPEPDKPKRTKPEVIISDTTRPRIITEDQPPAEETPKCELVASQESLWLLNGGGGLGVLVGFAGKADASKITARSSSPKDVEVSVEPEVGAVSGRAFFLIRSISTKTGAFTVTFDSPCGKKDIQVKVR